MQKNSFYLLYDNLALESSPKMGSCDFYQRKMKQAYQGHFQKCLQDCLYIKHCGIS